MAKSTKKQGLQPPQPATSTFCPIYLFGKVAWGSPTITGFYYYTLMCVSPFTSSTVTSHRPLNVGCNGGDCSTSQVHTFARFLNGQDIVSSTSPTRDQIFDSSVPLDAGLNQPVPPKP